MRTHLRLWSLHILHSACGVALLEKNDCLDLTKLTKLTTTDYYGSALKLPHHIVLESDGAVN